MQHSQLERLSERVQRLRAPNPGPMTLTGTNSYLIGRGPALVALDPGPLIESHLQTLNGVAWEQGAKIELILVTHGHPDHFPGAARLREITGAPVAAYKEAAFDHQVDLTDGQEIRQGEATFTALYTPGHALDHLCFYLHEEQALFTGDNILGTGTTVVAPPKGDMADYMASLNRLLAEYSEARVIYGGHGPQVNEPAAKFREYIAHRQARQRQLTEALAGANLTVPQIVERIYQDVDRRMWPAAARQVLAYLIMLEREGQVRSVALDAERVKESDQALLNPPPSPLDPVAAAELGISAAGDTLKVYSLVKNYTKS